MGFRAAMSLSATWLSELNDWRTKRDRCEMAGQQGPHWHDHGYARKISRK
jgi:hypothetical protein